jgi:hypothetical protein
MLEWAGSSLAQITPPYDAAPLQNVAQPSGHTVEVQQDPLSILR